MKHEIELGEEWNIEGRLVQRAKAKNGEFSGKIKKLTWINRVSGDKGGGRSRDRG